MDEIENDEDCSAKTTPGGEKNDNRTLITDAVMKEALKNDLGPNANLLSFEIKNFTKPGDNYTAMVTSALCKVELNGENFHSSYVIKLNNQWKISGGDQMSAEVFFREGMFFTKIKDCLNVILEELDEHHLHLPVCVYQNYELGKEMLIPKDLRERNYKMIDRHSGIDLKHATLVVEALAGVHAAGFIYKDRNKETSLLSLFPYLVDNWLIETEGKNMMGKFFTSLFENGVEILKDREGYELALEWLLNNKERALVLYNGLLSSGKDSFRTICHGDIWNNNILFRYNSQKEPEELILLDLQLCRVASIATDLNYFFMGSFNGDDRTRNLDTLFNSYYSRLESIMQKANVPLPFTVSELKVEYERILHQLRDFSRFQLSYN